MTQSRPHNPAEPGDDVPFNPAGEPAAPDATTDNPDGIVPDYGTE